MDRATENRGARRAPERGADGDLDPPTLRWVTDAVGSASRVVSVWRLPLGGWHVNHALDVADGRGHRHELVLRRWARSGWELDDPDYTVEREVRVLGLLAGTPVPAPRVVAADPDGARCDVPALLLSRLAGHPPGPPDVARGGFCPQLADALAVIHAVAVDEGAPLVPYRLYYDRDRARPAPWMAGSPVWTRATAAVRTPPPPTAMGLIHRDYHPENTLWSAGRLSGVVDWTQASWGPPALDVAHMRWNLAVDYGPAVADRFLACYRAATGLGLEHQAHWDLVSLLDLLLDIGEPAEPADLRAFERYAAALLADLA